MAAALLTVALLASCRNTEPPASNPISQTASSSAETTDTSTIPTEITAAGETEGTVSGAAPSTTRKPSGSASTTKGSTAANTTKQDTPSAKTLYIKDYGAKGDGVTDDASAIFVAMGALVDAGEGSTLVFESDKTYYAKSNGTSLQSILTLDGAKNVTIKGDNTTLLIDAPKYYVDFKNTTGVTLEGFNFDYKTKPAFRATLESLDAAAGEAVMIADRDIGMENGEVYTPTVAGNAGWFGVLDKPEGRYHMYIKQYTMLDKAARKFKITFDTGNGYTKDWLSQLNSVDLVAPMPYVGHLIERAFSLTGNTDFTMKNCNVYAMARFGFAVFDSEGTIRFTNVNLVRASNDLDKNLNFVGWRDGFHCKENRAKIIWDGCKMEGLYDDVFNISASTMYVKEANGQDEINMHWPETNGTYSSLKKGDKLTIIDTTTGQLIGTTTVSRVMKQSGSDNRIKLTDKLPGLKEGENILVFFDSMVAPGSEIKNCDLDGTFRFRGPLTVSDTKIYNRRMWIDIFGSTEGPVPQNIVFQNSPITLDSTAGIYFHISSYNNNTSASAYHIKNVVFQNCGVSRDNMEIGAGDQVTIR